MDKIGKGQRHPPLLGGSRGRQRQRGDGAVGLQRALQGRGPPQRVQRGNKAVENTFVPFLCSFEAPMAFHDLGERVEEHFHMSYLFQELIELSKNSLIHVE